MRRPRLLLSLALMAASLAVPAATAGSCTGVSAAKGITSSKLPQRPSTDTTAFFGLAVDPTDARRMWAWTLITVFTTVDGGCTWLTAYEVKRAAAIGYDQVTEVVPNPHPGSPRSVLLLLNNSEAVGTVLRSEGVLGDWAPVTGLPAYGKAAAAAQSPVDPKVTYLTFTQTRLYMPRTYVSRDGGRAWTAVQTPASSVTNTAYRVVPHPTKADELWATATESYLVGSDGLRYPTHPLQRSKDGGATWAGVGPVNILSLQLAPTRAGARVVALDSLRRQLFRSDDGETFAAVDVPPELASPWLALGRDADDLFLGEGQGGADADLFRAERGSKSWKSIAKGGFGNLLAHRSGRLIWLRGDLVQSMAY